MEFYLRFFIICFMSGALVFGLLSLSKIGIAIVNLGFK